MKVYTTENCEKWDEIVTSFENYDIFYLAGYAKACEINGDGKALLIYFDDGINRAINVVMKRDIDGIYSDYITPYGYGGFLICGDEKLVLEKYHEYCKENNVVCEFVRFNLFHNTHNFLVSETKTNNIVRSLNVDIEEIIADFEHKVRKNIKKAVKNNLEIIVDNSDDFLDKFLEIYYKTMDRNNANDNFYFKREYFEQINKMKNNIMYFLVKSNDVIISCELVLYGKNNIYSFLGGTLSEYFDLRPNDFLKFEIIKWSKDKGLSNFVLGGGYGSDDGIFKYKKSFSPSGIIPYYISKQIFNQEIYNKLCQEKNIENDGSFFPAYRKK